MFCCAVCLIAASAFGDGSPAGFKWLGYEAGLAKAKKESRPVVVEFSTGWCRECRKMEKETLSDPGVAKTLSERFVAVSVDGEKRADLASKYGVVAYPTVVVLEPSGAKAAQRIGFMSKEEFTAFMDYVRDGAYKRMSFAEYVKTRKK